MKFLGTFFVAIGLSDSFPEMTTKFGMLVAFLGLLIRVRGYGRPASFNSSLSKEVSIMLGTILLILLIIMVVGSVPTWPHSRNWGYFPSGGIGLILIVLIVLIFLGRVPIGL